MTTAHECIDQLIADLETLLKNQKQKQVFVKKEDLIEEKDYVEVPFSFDLLEKHHDKLFHKEANNIVAMLDMRMLDKYVFRIPKEKKQVRILYGISDGLTRVHSNLFYIRKEDRDLRLKRFHEAGSLSTCKPVTVIFED